jgi:hypothetical protein
LGPGKPDGIIEMLKIRAIWTVVLENATPLASQAVVLALRRSC